MMGSKIILGRRDRIDLPELGYTDLRVKMDTGAYCSVLHCSHIDVVRKTEFSLTDRSHLKYPILHQGDAVIHIGIPG